MSSFFKFNEGFNEFMDTEFEDSMIDAVRYDWFSNYIWLILFPDGTYDVRGSYWHRERPDFDAVVIRLPVMNNDDYDSANPSNSLFCNVEEEIRDLFSQALGDYAGHWCETHYVQMSDQINHDVYGVTWSTLKDDFSPIEIYASERRLPTAEEFLSGYVPTNLREGNTYYFVSLLGEQQRRVIERRDIA